MGAGASAGLAESLGAASDAELKDALAGLTPDAATKLQAALDQKASSAAKEGMAAMAMGSWSDKQSTDMISAIMNETTKGPPPDLFRKVRPFHMAEYTSKVVLGQDAPDGKVFELDGTHTTLLAKISSMGHGPGKLIVLNFGSFT